MTLRDDGLAYHHDPRSQLDCKLIAPVPFRLGKCLTDKQSAKRDVDNDKRRFRHEKMAAKKQSRKDYLARSRCEKFKAPRAPSRGRPAKKQGNRHLAQSPSLLERLFKESKATPARREKSADVQT